MKPYCWVIPKLQQGHFYKEKPKGMHTIPLYTEPPYSIKEVLSMTTAQQIALLRTLQKEEK